MLRRTLPLLTATATATVLLAVGSEPAPAATNDRPTTGTFAGEHSLGGPIRLTFERRSGIGLHLGRWSVKGTLKCADGESIRIDEGGIVTAKTAARVRSNRTFRLSTVVVKLDGRFVSSRRVTGTMLIRTSACEHSGSFKATRS